MRSFINKAALTLLSLTSVIAGATSWAPATVNTGTVEDLANTYYGNISHIPAPAQLPLGQFLGDYMPTGSVDSHLIVVNNGWYYETGALMYNGSLASQETAAPMPRAYYVYVPGSYNPSNPAPLLVLLHGGGLDMSNSLKPNCHTSSCMTQRETDGIKTHSEGFGSTQSVWTNSSTNPNAPWKQDWNPGLVTVDASSFNGAIMAQSLADQSGMLVAIPNGANDGRMYPSNAGLNYDGSGNGIGGNTWNDCTGNYQGYYRNAGTVLKPNWVLAGRVDDVAFITQMVLKMEASKANGGDQYNIDPSRIYVAGLSNGGTMAIRLAREMSGSGVEVAAAGVALANDGATATTDKTTGTTTLTLLDTCKNLSSQPNPVPLLMYKGEYDNFTVYHGGEAASGSTSWYIPYEPYVAGHPEWSNTTSCSIGSYPSASGCNMNTTNNVTFVTQVLNRYGLLGTSPSTKLAWSTNPRPADPSPASIWNADPSQEVIIDGNLEATGPVQVGNPPAYPQVNSVLNCDQYGGNTRKQVNNCVATYGGHQEPSWAIPVSALVENLGAQNLDIDLGSEELNFFSHFTLGGYSN